MALRAGHERAGGVELIGPRAAVQLVILVPVVPCYHGLAPTGDFGDAYDGGFGADVVLAYPITPLVTAYGDIGYTRFAGEGVLEDIDVWGFSAGAKVNLMTFYVGGEAGYFTEVDEFPLSPLIGMVGGGIFC